MRAARLRSSPKDRPMSLKPIWRSPTALTRSRMAWESATVWSSRVSMKTNSVMVFFADCGGDVMWCSG